MSQSLINKRLSIRVFIVQNGKILLQNMADSGGNQLIDSLGSFVTDVDDKYSVAYSVTEKLLGSLSRQITIKQVAMVHYTIHKLESQNNLVDTAVFLGLLPDNVLFQTKNPWKWYAYDRIPYDLIYPDVRLWLPQVLNDKLLEVHVEVKQSESYAQSEIIKKHIQSVEKF